MKVESEKMIIIIVFAYILALVASTLYSNYQIKKREKLFDAEMRQFYVELDAELDAVVNQF